MFSEKTKKVYLLSGIIAFSLLLFTCTKLTFDMDTNDEIPFISLLQKEITVTLGDEYTPDYKITDDEDSQEELLDSLKIWVEDDNGNSIELKKITEKIGKYTIFIKVTDSDGNVSGTVELIVTVTVDDKTPPVLTLLGPSPFLLNIGDTFKDPGAIAIDNVDGDISGDISKNGNVDVNSEGDYTLTYTVSDNAGNEAVIERIVKIKKVTGSDTEKPIITLVGSNPMELLVGKTYEDPGASAVDSIDGNISFKIIKYGTDINTSKPSTHYVYYTVTDDAGNTTTEIRIVNIIKFTDEIPPKITLLGKITMSLEKGDIYKESGATATDNIDGDITDKIIIDKSELDVQKAGTYKIYYSVKDAAGNSDSKERKVIIGIVDNEKPVIYLQDLKHFLLDVNTTFNDPGAYAIDNIDDTIQFKEFIVTHDIDTSKLGEYKVKYEVSDNAGNKATKERTVEVIDTIAPVITLKGPSTINLGLGFPYSENGVESAIDNLDGDVTSDVKISGSVNSDVGGNYIITYKVSDSHNNERVVERLVQIAKDTEAPVITLKGSNPMEIYLGQSYVEPGATASDNIEGDISDKIVIDGQVDKNIAGDYIITYTVSDLGGNEAKKERKVTVSADNVKPVITLKGTNPMPLKVGDSYNEPGATATDNVDGDLTNKININSSDVNTSLAGTYEVVYTVSDNSGNKATKKRSVVVSMDNTAPIITLKGSNPMNIQINGNYNEPGATANDNIDGNITNKIIITGSVNTSTVGQYKITYTVTDNAGNTASKKRTVNVVESGIIVNTLDKDLTIYTITEEKTYTIPSYGTNKFLILNKLDALGVSVKIGNGSFVNYSTWWVKIAATAPDGKLKIVIKPTGAPGAKLKIGWTFAY